MYKEKGGASIGAERVIVGEVDDMVFWTDRPAVNNPSLERLMGMSEDSLKGLAYIDENTVATELYLAPSDKAECDRRDLKPGSKYFGISRALVVLMYRKAARGEKPW
jgi:hypothetical protein